MKLTAALLAMAPMAIGPLPMAERTFVLSLCSGGEIAIPLDNEDGDQERDCRQQGCHAGTCRGKAKRPAIRTI